MRYNCENYVSFYVVRLVNRMPTSKTTGCQTDGVFLASAFRATAYSWVSRKIQIAVSAERMFVRRVTTAPPDKGGVAYVPDNPYDLGTDVLPG